MSEYLNNVSNQSEMKPIKVCTLYTCVKTFWEFQLYCNFYFKNVISTGTDKKHPNTICSQCIDLKGSQARGYKFFFMLNSAKHEILNAHKHKNIKKFSCFQAQVGLECYFFSLYAF